MLIEMLNDERETHDAAEKKLQFENLLKSEKRNDIEKVEPLTPNIYSPSKFSKKSLFLKKSLSST